MANDIHWSTLPRAAKSLIAISIVGGIVAMVECAFGIVTLLSDPNPSYAAAGLDPMASRAMEAALFFVVAVIQLWLAWMGWGAVREPKRLKPLTVTGGIVTVFCVLALLGELTQGGLGIEDAALIVPIFCFACALEAKRHLSA